MKIDLSGRVALITGAAEGIGKGCARVLAEAGADLVLFDIKGDLGRKTTEELSSTGVRYLFVEGDVANDATVARMAAAIDREFGALHILVNNAGFNLFKGVADTTADEWDRIQAVDLRALFMITKALLPLLKKANGASVINIGSVHAHLTVPDLTAYAAAKGGVVSMTRALCQELGPFRIRVNAVCPGFIMTPMNERWFAAVPDRRETMKRILGYHPLGEIGQPEDIGHLVTFLASDKAKFITGASFTVDGGLTSRLMH